MNVVTDAGSVGCFVVGAENRDGFSLALSDLQNQRNQMRFGMVCFALIWGRACGVEVPQAGVTQSVDFMKPLEHELDEEFGFAVSVRRMNGIVLLDWRAIGSSKQRCGGTEDEARNFVGENDFEQSERIRGVVAKILLWIFHRFAGFDGSSHVNHAIEFVFLENAIDRGAIARVAFDEFRALGHGGFVAVAEVVIDDDVVPALQEFGGDDTADVSGASGDEYAIGHGDVNPSRTEWLRRSTLTIKGCDQTGSGQDYIRNWAVMPVGGPSLFLRKDVILKGMGCEIV